MKKIVTIGDNCIDAYHDEQKFFSGGNSVNVAVYSKRFNVNSSYVGWVGTDDYGRQIINDIKIKKVDVTHIHVKNGLTAVTNVTLDGAERVFGQSTYGVTKDFELSSNDTDFILSHDMVHGGIWGFCDQYFEQLKMKGMTTSFDFSDCWDSELLETLIPHIDYAFMSGSEDTPMLRQLMIKLHANGANILVVTLGENGSILFDGTEFITCNIIKVDAVDTMGAGDSYIAGFLNGIVKDKPLRECMVIGSKSAALTVQYQGAW